MNFRKFIILSVPGWSNVDAWSSCFFQLGSDVFGHVDVFISSPWVLTRVAKNDSLGVKLDQAGTGFVVYIGGSLAFRAASFSQARTVAKILKALVFVGLKKVLLKCLMASVFSKNIIEIRVQESRSVFSDVTSLSSSLTTQDMDAISLLEGSNLYSLFHGTLELESEKLHLTDEVLRVFRNVTAFSSGPAQSLRLKSAIGAEKIKVEEVVIPRLERAIAWRGRLKPLTNVRSATFLSRRPSELPNFTKIRGWVSLGICSYYLRESGFNVFKVKSHPNESKLLKALEVTLLNFIFQRKNFKVVLSSELSEQLYESDRVITWFSGLVVEAGLAGVQCAELHGSRLSPWLGPILPASSIWNQIHRRGLATRLSSTKDLRFWLTDQSAQTDLPLESFEQNFFLPGGCKSRVSDVLRQI